MLTILVQSDPRSPAIDYRIVPGSFPNPVVSIVVCYTAGGRCRRRLDHGMVGYCVGVLLSTSFAGQQLFRGSERFGRELHHNSRVIQQKDEQALVCLSNK